MFKVNSTLTIGIVAKQAGVNVETIRFYQRKGLLNEPRKPLGGIRHYSSADIARLKFIKSAQRLGFNLNDITELLNLEDGQKCQETKTLAEVKLNDVRKKIEELAQIEKSLTRLVAACELRSENMDCPIIQSIHNR